MPSFSILNRGREVFYIYCLLGWHILLHQLLINMVSSRPILEGIPAEDSKHWPGLVSTAWSPSSGGGGQVALKANLRSLVGLLFILSSHRWWVKQQKCYPHHVFIRFNNFKNSNFDLFNKKNKRTSSTHS